MQGYDLSFLITFSILEDYEREKLIHFIIDFMEGIDSEISAMKIGINSRARSVASQYMRSFLCWIVFSQTRQNPQFYSTSFCGARSFGPPASFAMMI